MPHLHLETTADLVENAHVPDILAALGEALAEFSDFNSASIKAYHTLRSNWFVGEGHPAGFAHLTARILEGRTESFKSQVADRLFEVMQEQFADSIDADEAKITVEIVEMNRPTYRSS